MRVLQLFPEGETLYYHNLYFNYTVDDDGEHRFVARNFYQWSDGRSEDLIIKFRGQPDDLTRRGLLDPIQLL